MWKLLTTESPPSRTNRYFVTRDPAGNIKADKAKSGGKIDGISALIMALELGQAEEDAPLIDDIVVWV